MGRRSIRLPTFDYTKPGTYFVTICTQDLLPILGRVLVEEIVPSHTGEIVMKCQDKIPQHFMNSTQDIHSIMPNRIYTIVVLTKDRRDETFACDSNRSIPLAFSGAFPHIQKIQDRGARRKVFREQSFKTSNPVLLARLIITTTPLKFAPGNEIISSILSDQRGLWMQLALTFQPTQFDGKKIVAILMQLASMRRRNSFGINRGKGSLHRI